MIDWVALAIAVVIGLLVALILLTAWRIINQ